PDAYLPDQFYKVSFIGGSRVEEDRELISSNTGATDSTRRRIRHLHTSHFLDYRFDFVAVVIGAVDDYYISLSAGNRHAALTNESQLPGLEPPFTREPLPIELRVLVVPACHGYSCDLKGTDCTLVDDAVLRIHNAQGNPGQGASNFHKRIIVPGG